MKYRVLHHKKWRDYQAKYDEWWTLHYYREPNRFRRGKWLPKKYWAYDSGGGSMSPVRYYNLADARRAARHYGVEIEEVVNES